MVRRWTFEQLKDFGVIRKYGKRIFYVDRKHNFKVLLHLRGVEGYPISKVYGKQSGKGFFSGNIDMTLINYCANFDHDSGTCSQQDLKKRIDCFYINHYCNMFDFDTYISIRRPKNQKIYTISE